MNYTPRIEYSHSHNAIINKERKEGSVHGGAIHMAQWGYTVCNGQMTDSD